MHAAEKKSNIFRTQLANLDANPPEQTRAVSQLGMQGFPVDVFPEIPPGPYLTIQDILVIEGNSGTTDAIFTVRLHNGGTDVVTVGYATADHVAGAPADYASSSGTLTFQPGETEQTIVVAVTADTDPENDEAFLVNLVQPVNATIARAQANGRIYNDDCVTGLSAATYVGVTIDGCVNKAYRIEASYDGTATWVGLTNLTLTTSPYLWLDTISPAMNQRIYRSVLLPPP